MKAIEWLLFLAIQGMVVYLTNNIPYGTLLYFIELFLMCAYGMVIRANEN